MTDLKNDTCVQFEQTLHKYLVQACDMNDDKKSTCGTASHSDAICGPRPNTTYPIDGLHGDYCSVNAQCKSAQCKGHRCKGLRENEACIGLDDFSCEIGLACADVDGNKTYKCVKQAAVDGNCWADA